MVEIQITGLDFNQDVGPLIKSFYPNLEAEQHIIISLDLSEDKIAVKVLAPEDVACEADNTEELSNTVLYNAEEPFYSKTEDEKLRHREYRNTLLRAVYRALNKVTGKELPWGILTGVRPSKLVYERIERKEAGHLKYLEDTYYVSPKKAALATLVAAKEYQLLDKLGYKDGYSLYVGTPFCPSICNYCSFGSHPIGKFSALVEPYIEALKKELRFAATCFPDKKLQTIYFGGGTPTSITAEQLKDVIREVKSSFDMSHVVEFTVEAGRPDSITEEKLNMLKAEGVDRISINPQSMVQRTLDEIGRKHTVEQCIETFRLARACGFDNINMDIIAGLTGEGYEDFLYTLKEIEKLDPECLTVHTLSHKRAARLTTEAELYAGKDAVDVPMMVEAAADYARAHGYEPYYMYRQKNMTENLENVGYSKSGKESLYNILIMEEKQTILACGAGASTKYLHKTDGRFGRVENVKNVAEYISRIDEMIQRKREFFGLC